MAVLPLTGTRFHPSSTVAMRLAPCFRPRSSFLPLHLLALLAGCVEGGGEGGDSQEDSGLFVVEGATVFTSPYTEPQQDAVVVVVDGRIEAVGRRGEVAIPEGAWRVDGAGGVLLAGFQDLHVRLDPAFLRQAADPETPATEIEAWLQENFSRFGFTGILDTGSPLESLEPLLARIGAEGIRAPAIQGTGGSPLSGMVLGGGYGEGWSDGLVTELFLSDATLVPALSLLFPPADLPDSELAQALNELAAARGRLAGFHATGGRVGFGSGAGLGRAPNPLLELKLMEEAGLSFAAILATLTTEPALRLGQEARGEIDPGMMADLVFLEGDPRVDSSAFERVRWVMREGVLIYGTLR